MRLAGRTALVTGAAQGIGASIVARLIADGACVVGLDLLPPQEAPLVRLLDAGERLAWVEGDATHAADLARAAARAEERFGGIAIVVANAGVNTGTDAAELTEEAWDAFMAIDLKAAWLLVRAALPALRRGGGGSIVCISSIQAQTTMRGWFPYAAAKSGLLGLVRSLALDLGPEGIRANAITPGYIRTRLTDDHLRREGAHALDHAIGLHPLRRIGAPADVAALVAFLASDDAAFITAATLPVDGGLSAVLPQ